MWKVYQNVEPWDEQLWPGHKNRPQGKWNEAEPRSFYPGVREKPCWRQESCAGECRVTSPFKNKWILCVITWKKEHRHRWLPPQEGHLQAPWHHSWPQLSMTLSWHQHQQNWAEGWKGKEALCFSCDEHCHCNRSWGKSRAKIINYYIY